MSVLVSLNGVDLELGRDYYWLPEDGIHSPGKLVLRRPRPKVQPRTLQEKILLFLTFRWYVLKTPQTPYPDFVSIENWSKGFRESYFFGTQEFDRVICYHEDVTYAESQITD